MKSLILVIDDEIDITELIEECFEETKFNVISFNNSQEGLNFLKKNSVECVICDLYMKEVDGFEFISKLDRLDKKPPTILLTGSIDPHLESRAKESGFKEVIHKPFSLKSIINSVQRVTQKSF